MKHVGQLLVLPIAICCGCSSGVDGRESSEDKHEWSILQGREVETRDALVTGPKFSSRAGYVLLTIPSPDKSKNIWIMLSPKSPPFYKQLPQGNYEISAELLNIVEKRKLASSTVQEVLASHSRE